MSAYELGIEVSTILRGYLEARFAFSAGFQTTREFLGSAAKDPRLHGDHRAMLASFLGLCDAVKFARHPASHVEQDGLLDTAERFIREAAGPGATPGDAP
jgi:hypothetical protein